MAGLYVYVCTDYNSTTQDCVGVETFVPASNWLPAISMGDSILLGSLIVANWALAYAYKQTARVVRD